MRKMLSLVLAVAAAAALTACSKKDDDKAEKVSASGSLEFENETTTALFLDRPAVFQMKLIAAYVRFEQINEKTPDSAMIYLNPDCKDNIGTCDVSPGNHGAGGAAIENIVTNFFDFARSTEEVNEALNAQNREIVLYEPQGDDDEAPAGLTLKVTGAYLEFCKMITDDVVNVKWGVSESEVNELQLAGCVVASQDFETPVTIKEGETIKFSLSYSLDESITTGADATGDDCVGEGAEKTCFTMPKFKPSATK